MKSLKKHINNINWHYLSWIISIEVGLIMTVASFFLPGADDLHRFYVPFAQGCLNCGFVPYFSQWILFPLSIIPTGLVWPFWTVFLWVNVLWICKIAKTNPIFVMLSFPFMGQFWLGQIDVIVVVGLVIMLYSNNFYFKGFGIVLALVKPQISGLAVLIFVIHHLSSRDLLKIFVFPLSILIISFGFFGLSWPLNWLQNSLKSIPIHQWRLASLDLWPYGLLTIPTLFLRKPFYSRFKLSIVVSALATPFFGIYSYILFLLFESSWWTLLLSYIWVIAYPFIGVSAMRFAWILPASILVKYILSNNHRQIKTHEIQN